MKLILALSLLLMFVINSTAFAEERIPTISVSGEGIIETSPDRATISVGVNTRNKDASKVQAENARIAADVIKAVTALGVERRNIRTGNYSFHQYYRQDENRRRIFEGYEVNNSVTIIVDDLNLVGKVIDAALSHGANNVDSLQFGLRNKENLQREAIRLAVRDAREKAEIVATELGKSIVGVLNISVNSGAISAPRYSKMMAMAENDAAFETPIEGGTLNCSANVHVEFQISR